MPAVAALLDSRAAHLALRRTLSEGSPAVLACRSPASLRRAFQTHLLDAVVVGSRVLRDLDLTGLRQSYPGIPVLLFGPVRPDDGDGLVPLLEQRLVSAVVVDGVDDAVAGDLVRRHTVSAGRQGALAAAPRLLRLTEPLQLAAWRRLVSLAGRATTTAELARALDVSREHLSRQFAAGGAPNLKRVIDLLRIVSAAGLLANPGYDLKAVARVLRFGTVSHLNAMSRRIAGRPAGALGSLTPDQVVGAFLRVGTRSRV